MREKAKLLLLLPIVTVRRRARRCLACLAVGLAAATLLATSPAQAAPNFVFRGRGWGHAIGVSQWGAHGLAGAGGWPAARILSHFYRGTAIGRPAAPSRIRVGLLQEQSAVRVTANGRFDFYDRNGALRVSGAANQVWDVHPVSGNRLGVFDHNGATRFVSPSPVLVRYETRGSLLRLPQTGRQYRYGTLELTLNTTTARMRAVVVPAFEQYLYGLGEVPASWPTEALKVQAIAARTYALEKVTRLGQNRSVCNCGVYASTADQAYVGVSHEVPRWVGAVNATRGQVVTYGGKAIQAYYSSSDGGFTEHNENGFGGSALPYLRGVCDPGDYSHGSNPHSNWSVTMNGDQIGSRLRSGGYNVGSVTRIEYLAPRGVSGRVLRVIDSGRGGVRVTGSSGTARISGDRFRSLLGLKSTLLLHHITGHVRIRYDALRCAPGLPTGMEFTWRDLSGLHRGSAQGFKNGRLFRYAGSNKVFWTRGAILAKYDDLRRHGTDLGLPVTDEYAVSGGRRSDFERGSIVWNASTGKTGVYFR